MPTFLHLQKVGIRTAGIDSKSRGRCWSGLFFGVLRAVQTKEFTSDPLQALTPLVVRRPRHTRWFVYPVVPKCSIGEMDGLNFSSQEGDPGFLRGIGGSHRKRPLTETYRAGGYEVYG